MPLQGTRSPGRAGGPGAPPVEDGTGGARRATQSPGLGVCRARAESRGGSRRSVPPPGQDRRKSEHPGSGMRGPGPLLPLPFLWLRLWANNVPLMKLIFCEPLMGSQMQQLKKHTPPPFSKHLLLPTASYLLFTWLFSFFLLPKCKLHLDKDVPSSSPGCWEIPTT